MKIFIIYILNKNIKLQKELQKDKDVPLVYGYVKLEGNGYSMLIPEVRALNLYEINYRIGRYRSINKDFETIVQTKIKKVIA